MVCELLFYGNAMFVKVGVVSSNMFRVLFYYVFVLLEFESMSDDRVNFILMIDIQYILLSIFYDVIVFFIMNIINKLK